VAKSVNLKFRHRDRRPRPGKPDGPEVLPEESPHGCYEGFVYLGELVVGDDGLEVEVYTAVPCRRCNATSETL
jgi:hypothetical protein